MAMPSSTAEKTPTVLQRKCRAKGKVQNGALSLSLSLVAHIRSAELGFTVNRLQPYRLPFTVSGRLALAHYVPLPWQYCCIFL